MWKVTVNATNPLRSGGSDFETQELAQAWIDSQSQKLGRRPARTEEIDGEEVSFEAEAEFILEDISAQVNQAAVNAESQALLDSTDWMVIRFMETGVEVPEEISLARSEARAAIVR